MRLRRLLVALALGISLACAATLASAQQIYKWKDANGVVHFSQTPPASGTHYTRLHLHGLPETPHNQPTTAGKPQPQPQHARTNGPSRPSPATSTQPDTPGNRAKLCKRLASNIALLQSKQPVVTKGGHGKQMVLSDDAREQQLATARAQQTQYCGSKGT